MTYELPKEVIGEFRQLESAQWKKDLEKESHPYFKKRRFGGTLRRFAIRERAKERRNPSGDFDFETGPTM